MTEWHVSHRLSPTLGSSPFLLPHALPFSSPPPPDEALSAERSAGEAPIMPQTHSWLVMLSAAQSPAAPVDPLQQAYAGMQHYTGEAL